MGTFESERCGRLWFKMKHWEKARWNMLESWERERERGREKEGEGERKREKKIGRERSMEGESTCNFFFAWKTCLHCSLSNHHTNVNIECGALCLKRFLLEILCWTTPSTVPGSGFTSCQWPHGRKERPGYDTLQHYITHTTDSSWLQHTLQHTITTHNYNTQNI